MKLCALTLKEIYENVFKKKKKLEAQGLGAHSGLAENLCSVPSTEDGQLTISGKHSASEAWCPLLNFKGTSTQCTHPHSNTRVHMPIHTSTPIHTHTPHTIKDKRNPSKGYKNLKYNRLILPKASYFAFLIEHVILVLFLASLSTSPLTGIFPEPDRGRCELKTSLVLIASSRPTRDTQ